MLRDPKLHSKFIMKEYRIVEMFDDKIKLDDNSWISREGFEKKFIRINKSSKVKTYVRLPLFEKYSENA